MAARVNYLSGNVKASTTRAGHLAPMKDYLPDQRDRDWQRRERNLNAERPSLRRRLILGIILGSFFFLVVSCFYWAEFDVPKIDRAKLKFNRGDRQ
jgi:hypothetical protein